MNKRGRWEKNQRHGGGISGICRARIWVDPKRYHSSGEGSSGRDPDLHSGCDPRKRPGLGVARRGLRDPGRDAGSRRIRGRMHGCGLGSTWNEGSGD
jgi:hypothetical protein